MRQDFIVGDEEQDTRIDQYLAGILSRLSRSYIQKLLKDGDISVNGRLVKSSYKVSGGDCIICAVPDAAEPEIEAEPIKLDILYEDEDVILINKPKGMVVTGGVAMIIIFAVDNKIFAPDFGKKK